FEVSGSIKWFDPSKGYGFILPDEDLPDVLLHVSCLRRDGFQTAYEGLRIVCDVVKTPKGLQAARIRGMDDSTAIRPAQLPQRTLVVVAITIRSLRGGVYNRWTGSDERLQVIYDSHALSKHLLRRLVVGNVDPGSHYLRRAPCAVADNPESVANPDVVALAIA